MIHSVRPTEVGSSIAGIYKNLLKSTLTQEIELERSLLVMIKEQMQLILT